MTQILFRHLVRNITLLCMTFGVCICEANTVKTGVGIFDTLFISANTSLRINGDLYLKHAHVLGKGSLIIQEENHSKIVSRNSEVNNLEVITEGEVNLEGGLVINQSLTVQSGIFDATSGELVLSDSTKIRLLTGARIQFKSELAGLPSQSGFCHLLDFFAKAILNPSLIVEENLLWKIQQRYIEPTRCLMQVHKDVASVPPEVC